MLALILVLFLAVLLGLVLYRAMVPKHVFFRRPLKPYLIGFCVAYGALLLLLVLLITRFAAPVITGGLP